MERVLRPGGSLLLSVPFSHLRDHAEDKWRFSARELNQLFTDAGFTNIQLLSQGGFLGGMAHLFKTKIKRLKSRWLRQFSALCFAPVVELLYFIDQKIGHKKLFSQSPTGYMVVAHKTYTMNKNSALDKKIEIAL
jgi:hypothetical protein